MTPEELDEWGADFLTRLRQMALQKRSMCRQAGTDRRPLNREGWWPRFGGRSRGLGQGFPNRVDDLAVVAASAPEA